MAILDLIPQIGATLGAVVVTLVGLTQSVWIAIACAVFFIVYQQVENWIVYPTVMRKSVKVSDLAAIIPSLRLSIFGILIIFFLVVEPEGLNRLWRNVRGYIRTWPFSY